MKKDDKINISVISGRFVPTTYDESSFSKSESYQSQLQIHSTDSNDYENENRKSNDDSDGHHIVSHPTNYMETMLHLFRGNIGSGLLAMGDAFRNGGIVFATISTALLGIICVHAQHLLLNCSEALYHKLKMNKPPGFADTVALVFLHGPIRLRPFAGTMRILINTFLCITQLGFCCVYIVFIAGNVKMV